MQLMDGLKGAHVRLLVDGPVRGVIVGDVGRCVSVWRVERFKVRFTDAECPY